MRSTTNNSDLHALTQSKIGLGPSKTFVRTSGKKDITVKKKDKMSLLFSMISLEKKNCDEILE